MCRGNHTKVSVGLLPRAFCVCLRIMIWCKSQRERPEDAVKLGVAQSEITNKFQSGMKDPQHCPQDLLKETRPLPSSGELSQRTIMPSPKLAQCSTQCPMNLSISKWNMVLIFGKQYFDWKTFRDFFGPLSITLYFQITFFPPQITFNEHIFSRDLKKN